MLPKKDPVMLLSAVNMKLRDVYPSLEELCRAMDEDAEEIQRILDGIDYKYDADSNRFVQAGGAVLL